MYVCVRVMNVSICPCSLMGISVQYIKFYSVILLREYSSKIQYQNQNSLLVLRETDNYSPRTVTWGD